MTCEGCDALKYEIRGLVLFVCCEEADIVLDDEQFKNGCGYNARERDTI